MRCSCTWLSPVIGVAVLGYALWSANTHAKVIGVLWLLVGAGIAGWFHVGQRRDREPAPVAREQVPRRPLEWPTGVCAAPPP